MQRYRTVLTIAGSDSGGGAGIQADIKAISACGCFAASAVTAITAQNTVGVSAIHPVPVPVLEAQIKAVLEDIGADSVKIGMLHSEEVITCVADMLARFEIANVVLDPVMVATSGDRLIQEEAVAAMVERLFPLVRLITPNVPEAEILLDEPAGSIQDIEAAAKRLGQRFRVNVLAKGGHLEGPEICDALYEHDTGSTTLSRHEPQQTRNTHGTGCTLSSAVAAHLAAGLSLADAVAAGLDYVAGAIEAGSGFTIGRGHGPVHHFYRFW